MHGHIVNTVADLSLGIRQLVPGLQALGYRSPGLTAIVGAEGARGRDRNKNPVRVARVQKDGVQTHPPGARLPEVSFDTTQPRKLLPCLPSITRAEQSSIFHPGINRIWIGWRRFEIPDPLEFPGMLGPIKPLVGAGDTIVGELIAHRLPCLAAIVRALDQ